MPHTPTPGGIPSMKGPISEKNQCGKKPCALLTVPSGLSLSQIVAPEAPRDEDREKSVRRD